MRITSANHDPVGGGGMRGVIGEAARGAHNMW
jgi:hypothetical protein